MKCDMKKSQNNVIEAKAEEPTSEDLFYIKWGRETHKDNIGVLNNVLRQFITLDTALLAVLIAFFDKIQICKWIKVLSCALLMFSLVMAVFGIIPLSSDLDLRRPDLIKAHKKRVLIRKKRLMWISVSSFVLSFIIILIVLIFGDFGQILWRGLTSFGQSVFSRE